MILLAVLSGIAEGLSQVIIKHISLPRFKAETYLFVLTAISVPITLPMLFWSESTFHMSSFVSVGIALIGFIIGNIFIISAYKFEDISNIVLVSKVNIIISLMAGLIFYAEVLSSTKLMGCLFIIASLVVIFYEKRSVSQYKGLLFAFASGFGFAIAAIASKNALSSIDPYTYVFIINLGIALATAFLPGVLKEAPQLIRHKFWYMVMAEVFAACSFILYLYAISRFSFSIGNTIQESVGVVVPVVIGVLFLREKSNITNKLMGLLLLIIGIVLTYK